MPISDAIRKGKRDHQRKMMEQGRCVTCSRPHDRQRARCSECQAKVSKASRIKREKRKSENLCVQCGATKLRASKFVRCFDCRDRIQRGSKRSWITFRERGPRANAHNVDTDTREASLVDTQDRLALTEP